MLSWLLDQYHNNSDKQKDINKNKKQDQIRGAINAVQESFGTTICV